VGLPRIPFGILSIAGLVLALLAPAAGAPPPQSSTPEYRVLVFTKAAGEVHASTQAGVQAIRTIGKDAHFAVEATDDADKFRDHQLERYRTVVFLNTTGDVLTDAQQAAFEDYFHDGGGFVGIHAAIEAEPDWQFLTDVLGARATGETELQTGTVKVADRVHDASKSVPEYWNRTDRWYSFDRNVRGVSHVLATVVEEPFAEQPSGLTLNAIDGATMGADHPVAWCKDFQGGRSFYTAGGHTTASFSEADFREHLGGAIQWAAGQSDPVYSDCGATVLANYQMSFVAAPPNLSEPIGFDVLPDGTGRVIQTDRRGGVRLHDPATNATTLLAQVPVYIANEDGMYGPEVDNNFNQNHWIYLFYAPPTVEDVRFADGTLHTVTTPLNDPDTPANEQNAPNVAPSQSAWDNYVGYFQLSRFKFVEATGSEQAHLDLSSEQQILRVPNNRGACCHVAGDIDFDSHNNLWLVTGDDTPAGGGNSGGFGPFNGQLTNEAQTLTVAGATSGTFTLTFDGQTTAPIPFPLQNTAIEAALEALPNLTDVGVSGNAPTSRTINFGGDRSAQNVPLLTGDASGLTGSSPTVTAAVAMINNGQGVNIPAEAGQFWAPHVDARRTAQNTNDLRGKVLRFHVKDGDITAAEENRLGGAYTVPEGNLFAPGTPRTRPEVYAMGFRNPFRITLDENDVAYVTDYSPDSQTPQIFRGPPGTGRVEVVREPANYGWPLCMRPDLPYYQWDFETGAPLPSAASPETFDCDDPAQGPQNSSHWVAEGGPTVEPGLEFGPPITEPEISYSYRDNQAAPNGPQGTPCFAAYGPGAPTNPVGACPQLFPELFTGGVGPHGAAPYDFDPDNPSTTKFPPYYDGAFILGEFTQDTLREVRLDSQDRVFKINNALNCGAAPTNPARPFLCDNPMDMEFGPDGSLYLLTYGDGFFNINPDAAMERFEYVKGLRAPIAVLGATPTSGQPPLTVQFSSEGSRDPDPGDSIRFDWDFDGDGTVDSVDENPSHTYTANGVYTARLTVTDSSGKTASANTTITVGNTSPSVDVTVPVEGGLFAFGESIPFHVAVSDPEDGPIDCGRVQVTFVLGHDTHGHAEATVTGCSGVLPTLAEDVSHGGNVFGVISASYTDLGGAGGVPALTTVDQHQIRQKRQEVEFAVNQSGTNTAASADEGGGLQRGGLGNGDWIQLNGPFNLVNINSITFRISGGSGAAGTGLVELHRDAVDGPLVGTFTIQPTADATTYASQNFAITDPGGTHELFLVFRPVDGGLGNNFFNLNWVEFVGGGVGTP
jgi:PKD repeat protein/type 1 glutamine amidotransferase